jgi:hypothetical protein
MIIGLFLFHYTYKVSAVFKSVFNCYMMLQTGTDKVSVNKEFELSGIFIFILMILYSVKYTYSVNKPFL